MTDLCDLLSILSRLNTVLSEGHGLIFDGERAINRPQQKSITQADVDQLIENLQSLARSHPEAHRRLVDQLKRAIAAEDKRKAGNQDVPGV